MPLGASWGIIQRGGLRGEIPGRPLRQVQAHARARGRCHQFLFDRQKRPAVSQPAPVGNLLVQRATRSANRFIATLEMITERRSQRRSTPALSAELTAAGAERHWHYTVISKIQFRNWAAAA